MNKELAGVAVAAEGQNYIQDVHIRAHTAYGAAVWETAAAACENLILDVHIHSLTYAEVMVELQ